MARTTRGQLTSMARHLSELSGLDYWTECESGVWSLRRYTGDPAPYSGETVVFSAMTASELWDQMRAAMLFVHEMDTMGRVAS